MADTVNLLMFLLVFVTGFVTGKLFAALQFAGFKMASKIAPEDYQARKSVNRLIRLGGKL